MLQGMYNGKITLECYGHCHINRSSSGHTQGTMGVRYKMDGNVIAKPIQKIKKNKLPDQK